MIFWRYDASAESLSNEINFRNNKRSFMDMAAVKEHFGAMLWSFPEAER